MKNFFYLYCLITFFIISCRQKINDYGEFKNENWIFFENTLTKKNEWIKKGKSRNDLTGKYTLFYNDGKIFEKGRLKNGKQIDTVCYYSTNEELEKYKIIKHDSLIYYYLKNNEVYKNYTQTYEKAFEGRVKNHNLTEIKAFGSFGEFNSISHLIYPVKMDLLKTLLEVVHLVIKSENNEKTNSLILDSMIIRLNKRVLKSKNELFLHQELDNDIFLKNTGYDFLYNVEIFSNNELKSISRIVKDGNKTLTFSQKVGSILQKSKISDNYDTYGIVEDNFIKKNNITDEQINIIKNQYPIFRISLKEHLKKMKMFNKTSK